MNLSWARSLRGRLAQRRDGEHVQSLVRLAVVAAAVVYLYALSASDGAVPRPENLQLGRHVALVSLVVSFGLFFALVARPSVSPARRLVGITHDVAFLSCAMYLGEAGSAPFAALYLLVTLGNGFRYGVRYLLYAATLSVAAFAAIYLSSDFWQREWTLTFNIFMVLTLVPFYVARLLATLHDTKEQLRKQAAHDSLTGVLSRAELEARVTDVLAREAGNHALLFCDLDLFKRVNDVAGHAAGDKLLADISAIISRSIRAGDYCGRTGGDEFCVLLRGCPLEKAREIAEQIRSKVAGYRLAWGHEYFSVGISIGVAPTSAVADATSLFRLADAACYAAKNSGRNKIHIVDPRVDSIDTAQVRRLVVDTGTHTAIATTVPANAAATTTSRSL